MAVKVVQIFEYPECPWADDFEGLSERIADAFPGADRLGGERQERNSDAGNGSGYGATTGFTPGHGSGDSNNRTEEHTAESQAVGSELTNRIAEETDMAEERGHAKGVETGLALAREEASQQVAAERNRLHSQAESIAGSFQAEREQYFHQLEQESVRLALAIAARVLRREANMDPLLLTGAVRVALGQLAESTTVRLRVPLVDQPLWEEAVKLMPGLRLRPLVVADERLDLGDCRLETELGSVDLGLRAQLREIERGFFDRVGGMVVGSELEEKRVNYVTSGDESDPGCDSGRDCSPGTMDGEREPLPRAARKAKA